MHGLLSIGWKPTNRKPLFPYLAVLLLTACYQTATIDVDDADPHSGQDPDTTDGEVDTAEGDTGTDLDSVFICGTEYTFGLWQWQRDIIEAENTEVTAETLGTTHYIRFSPMPDDDYLAGSYAVMGQDREIQYGGYFAFTTGQWEDTPIPILLMWEETGGDSDSPPTTGAYTSQAVPIDIPDCDTLVFFYYAENADGDEIIVASEYTRLE